VTEAFPIAPDYTQVLTAKAQPILNPNEPKTISLSDKTEQARSDLAA
jgi:hypothetical protein